LPENFDENLDLALSIGSVTVRIAHYR